MNRRSFLKFASLASLVPFLPNIPVKKKSPEDWGDLSSIKVSPGTYEIVTEKGRRTVVTFTTEGPHKMSLPGGAIVDMRRMA